jgi:hypothetical protein
MFAEVDQDRAPPGPRFDEPSGDAPPIGPSAQDPVQKQHVTVGIGRPGGLDAVGKHKLGLPQMAG